MTMNGYKKPSPNDGLTMLGLPRYTEFRVQRDSGIANLSLSLLLRERLARCASAKTLTRKVLKEINMR